MNLSAVVATVADVGAEARTLSIGMMGGGERVTSIFDGALLVVLVMACLASARRAARNCAQIGGVVGECCTHIGLGMLKTIFFCLVTVGFANAVASGYAEFVGADALQQQREHAEHLASMARSKAPSTLASVFESARAVVGI